jgi:hypothetical protein
MTDAHSDQEHLTTLLERIEFPADTVQKAAREAETCGDFGDLGTVWRQPPSRFQAHFFLELRSSGPVVTINVFDLGKQPGEAGYLVKFAAALTSSRGETFRSQRELNRQSNWVTVISLKDVADLIGSRITLAA